MNNPTPSIVIEELSAFSSEDAKAIRELVSKLGSSFQELSDEDFKEILASPTTHLITARDTKNQRIVGMATLAVYRIPYLKKAYLDDFIISDNYQEQGLGSKLINEVLKKAKESKASYIEFTSNPKRESANKFYQKFGFQKRNTNVYRLVF